MRVAIIIVSVIGLIFLGIKWDTLSTPHNTPQEMIIIKKEKADKHLTCPKCDKDVEIIQMENDEKRKFCKIHGMVAVNFQ